MTTKIKKGKKLTADEIEFITYEKRRAEAEEIRIENEMEARGEYLEAYKDDEECYNYEEDIE